MAGWRVGFFVGNTKLIGALQKIKSWLDYGMFTPIQMAATTALNGSDDCVKEITKQYDDRQNKFIEEFDKIGWHIKRNKATMFIWAKIPDCVEHLGSLEFTKRLLQEQGIAMSPGVGFGEDGEGYVRIALIEDYENIKKASLKVKEFLEQFLK
jgi:alanine-synthesizing transaminase